MSQAALPSEVATRIYDLLDFPANQLLLLGPLGSLFYGDQGKLPTTPTVCVEAGTTTRAFPSSVKPGGLVENQHECWILVYHSAVQEIETNKKESELIAEGIVKFLDKNLQLVGPNGEEGAVVQGWCSSVDPGYAVKAGTLFKAVRIQWNGMSKTRLGV